MLNLKNFFCTSKERARNPTRKSILIELTLTVNIFFKVYLGVFFTPKTRKLNEFLSDLQTDYLN